MSKTISDMSAAEYGHFAKTGSSEPEKRNGGTIYRDQKPDREPIESSLAPYAPYIRVLRVKTNTLLGMKIRPARLDAFYERRREQAKQR